MTPDSGKNGIGLAYRLCMAGLLHDLGKIGQRASEYCKYSSGATFDQSRLGSFLPSNNQGGFSHWHVAYTMELLDKAKHLCPPGSQWGGVQGIALAHHKPGGGNLAESILARADRLASAMDRQSSEEYEKRYKEYRETALVSTLSLLKLKGSSIGKEDVSRLPLREGLENVELDNSTQKDYRCNKDDYSKLWSGLVAAVSEIDSSCEADAVLEKLASIVDWYSWTVPAATNAFPDISLSEHSKAVAIIASAIGAFFETEGGDESGANFGELFGSEDAVKSSNQGGAGCGKLESDCGGSLFRLVIGDLAGIQNFITDTKTDGASRNLKARSFLVDMWADRIAALVLREFGMPEVCRIYATGGKFLLLLPNVSNADEKLKKIRKAVNADFESCFGMELSTKDESASKENGGGIDNQINIRLRLASVPVSQGDLYAKRLGERLRELMDRELQKQSARPDFGELEQFFAPQEPSDCTISNNEEKTNFEKAIEALGRNLAKVERVNILEGKGDFSSGHIPIPGAGECIALSKSDSKGGLAKSKLTFAFNAFNSAFDGLRWYAGYKQPVWPDNIESSSTGFWKELKDKIEKGDDAPNLERGERPKAGDLLTFDAIDKAAKVLTGFGRVGILRMDVDNLGWLLSQGLDVFEKSELSKESGEGHPYSLGRLMSLSSLLVKFFSGLLPRILDDCIVKYGGADEKPAFDEQGNPVKASDLVFTIYAGGDDAFLLGPWSLMPEIAMSIRECFRKWMGGNDDVGISAGIALVSGKFPISVAAEDAGACESAAKNLSREWEREVKYEIRKQQKERPVQKDRMDFLEFTADWNEWNWIEEKRSELVGIACKTGEQGLIRMLGKVAIAYLQGRNYLSEMEKFEQQNENKKKQLMPPDFVNPWRWKPLLEYSIARSKDRGLSEKFAKYFVSAKTCDLNTKSNDPGVRQPVQYLATVVRWADYLSRNVAKKKKEASDVAG